MLVALMADIHSNFPALKAVLAKIDELGVEKIFCCGDVIGYASMPNQCIKEIIKRKIACVMGNHELALLDKKLLGWFNDKAIEALLWHEKNLEDFAWRWLKKLGLKKKIKANNKKFLLCHGSPESCLEYVYFVSDEILEHWLCKYKVNTITLGHTHIPLIKKTKQGLLLNPGSVGQPRDGNNKASFALLNTATMEAEIVRVAYDIDEIARDIRQKGLPEFFAERLYEGV